ncbi:hypothetical protein BDD12DRAFT_96226 [Trichophaea hybrida]|nr:hypothetical protein BDD12DRAFT_96226 [Trichophaea hybrida]
MSVALSLTRVGVCEQTGKEDQPKSRSSKERKRRCEKAMKVWEAGEVVVFSKAMIGYCLEVEWRGKSIQKHALETRQPIFDLSTEPLVYPSTWRADLTSMFHRSQRPYSTFRSSPPQNTCTSKSLHFLALFTRCAFNNFQHRLDGVINEKYRILNFLWRFTSTSKKKHT